MLFFIIVIVALCLMYGYIGWRLIVPAAFSLSTNLLLWSLLVALLILPFIPTLLRLKGTPHPAMDVTAWVAYVSFGFITILFVLLAARDLAMGAVILYQKIAALLSSHSGVETAVADPERRQMLINTTNLCILAVTGGLTGYGMFQARRRPAIVEVKVPITGLPQDLSGFTIVQITDLHAGNTIQRPFIQTVVDMVNELRPDVVVLTGDLADGSVEQLGDRVAPLGQLRAREGRYFVTGNHEYYAGVQSWLKETERLGFTNLVNEHRVIERGHGRLLMAGVSDYTGGDFRKDHISDPHKALIGAPECHAKILLAHQPKSIFEAEKAGYDYVISGHTHGGQYFANHVLAALLQPHIAGFHRHGKTSIYVSRGTGYWGPPIRIGARSEITVHRLLAG